MARLPVLLVASACVAAWVGACSQVQPPDAGSEGAVLYTANCSECHGVDAGGLTAPSLRTGLAADQVRTALASPVDGTSHTGTLDDDQVRTIVDYVVRIGASGDGER